MKQFFLNLINSTNPSNSRVFTGLILLLVFIIEVIVSFFIPVELEIIYSTIAFCAAMFGLSVVPFRNNT